jgi:hypothetical protein
MTRNPFAWQRLPRWRVAAVDPEGRTLHDFMHAETASAAAEAFAHSTYALTRGAVVTGTQRANR